MLKRGNSCGDFPTPSNWHNDISSPLSPGLLPSDQIGFSQRLSSNEMLRESQVEETGFCLAGIIRVYIIRESSG